MSIFYTNVTLYSRMCLHVQTCFGATIVGNDCFLKNEKCFTNLKPREGALVGGNCQQQQPIFLPKTGWNNNFIYVPVLNVVREDYKCGCHYPFTRKTSAGEILTWNPECPAVCIIHSYSLLSNC